MSKAIDTKAIEEHVRGLLTALGDNPDREGLAETPQRVARMYAEVFEGMCYSNKEIAEMFGKSFSDGFENAGTSDGTDFVLVKDIETFSFCEHHMALMYDMKISVAYIPNGKVLGLSKIARIADMAAKRLQLQERIGTDIAEIMQLASGSKDVAVLISANHSCMTARGIKKPSSQTRTITLREKFRTDTALQNRLLQMTR
ncbi:MAG: GTP cyclohydrolase I [Oscillospiraceae bacterium]|nr:GTP cyclohydrolase I [Oscillospiraceae bacterium]